MIISTTCRGGLPCQVEIYYSSGDPYTGIPSGWEVIDVLDSRGRRANWIEPTDEDWKRFEKEAEEQASDI